MISLNISYIYIVNLFVYLKILQKHSKNCLILHLNLKSAHKIIILKILRLYKFYYIYFF